MTALCAVSVIVPVYNEGRSVLQHLDALYALLRPCDELIIVDGGSTDNTWSHLQGWLELHSTKPCSTGTRTPVILLASGKGRALQMNTGARAASSSMLLFVHADTEIPQNTWSAWHKVLEGRSDVVPLWGRFNVKLIGQSPWLPMISWFINQRSRFTRIATGDQCVFVDSSLFEAVGGYAELPLMEDIELCKRLKATGGAQCVAMRERVNTSGRRWDSKGAWRTIVLMWKMRWLYWRGVPADQLAKMYRDIRAVRVAVALFAKFPQAGKVKTRLIPKLGAEGAAEFARYLLIASQNKLHSACQLSSPPIASVDLFLWTDGGSEADWATLSASWVKARLEQPNGHLGLRMRFAVQHHLADHDVVLLLGPDAIEFQANHVVQLVQGALEKTVALAPAHDGGYVAMALHRPSLTLLEQLFSGDIRWGTSSVLQQSKEAMAQQQIVPMVIPVQHDIDEPDDLDYALRGALLPPDWSRVQFVKPG